VDVRRLGTEDAASARAALSTLKETGHGPLPSEARLAGFLSRAENIFLVASLDAMPRGFLLAYALDRVDRDRPMLCLYEIGVAVKYRGSGVGTRLVRELLRVCAQIDATEVWTITNRSNVAATRLFEATGGVAPAVDDVVYVWEE
jgi:ribosomal protein S18 acetylase RimI-like enzyme